LEPCHVDLREFAFSGDAVALMPGGLTRVGLNAATLVVKLLAARGRQGHLAGGPIGTSGLARANRPWGAGCLAPVGGC
jgi:hypothetical protein